MASIFFKRIAEKYGTEDITGGRYQDVISDVLAQNNMKMARAVNRLTNDSYKKTMKNFPKEKAKTIKLPDVSEVLPKQSVFLIKSAEQGKMITQNFRSDLERKLRASLKEFDGSGEQRLEGVSGRAAGRINPKLIENFRSSIEESFVSRTDKDPATGVPGNVRNIAITEIRSTVDQMKEEHAKQLLKKNPDLEMVKMWIHNKRLSKKPRIGHMALNRVTIPMNEKFKVNRENGSGFDFMTRPHDPEAPAEQNISCSCDAIYKARFKEQ